MLYIQPRTIPRVFLMYSHRDLRKVSRIFKALDSLKNISCYFAAHDPRIKKYDRMLKYQLELYGHSKEALEITKGHKSMITKQVLAPQIAKANQVIFFWSYNSVQASPTGFLVKEREILEKIVDDNKNMRIINLMLDDSVKILNKFEKYESVKFEVPTKSRYAYIAETPQFESLVQLILQND